MPGRKRKKTSREEFRKALWSAGDALLLVSPEREGRRERAIPYLMALLGKLHEMEASTYTENPDTDRPYIEEKASRQAVCWQDLPTLDSPANIRVTALLNKTRKEVMEEQEGPPRYVAETIRHPEQYARMSAQSEAMAMVDTWILEALNGNQPNT
jgi:hypothetical protein